MVEFTDYDIYIGSSVNIIHIINIIWVSKLRNFYIRDRKVIFSMYNNRKVRISHTVPEPTSICHSISEYKITPTQVITRHTLARPNIIVKRQGVRLNHVYCSIKLSMLYRRLQLSRNIDHSQMRSSILKYSTSHKESESFSLVRPKMYHPSLRRFQCIY